MRRNLAAIYIEFVQRSITGNRIGVTVPTGDRNVLGTPVLLNATAQYHLRKYLWPEVEVNSTIWANGKNDGKKQAFVSPGLVIGKLHLWKRR